MGVIHKLKQEVVDFILAQKRENPRLGCRKIADLVSERFQTKVSKSSVNAVIKDASLSSPVGRRAKRPKREKKFTIPKEKKEQIFAASKEQLIEHKEETHVPEVRPEFPLEETQKEEVEEPQEPVPQEETAEPIALPAELESESEPQEEPSAGEIKKEPQLQESQEPQQIQEEVPVELSKEEHIELEEETKPAQQEAQKSKEEVKEDRLDIIEEEKKEEKEELMSKEEKVVESHGENVQEEKKELKEEPQNEAEEESEEKPVSAQEAPSEPKKPEQEKEPQEEIKQEAPPAQEAPPEPEKPEEREEPKEEPKEISQEEETVLLEDPFEKQDVIEERTLKEAEKKKKEEFQKEETLEEKAPKEEISQEEEEEEFTEAERPSLLPDPLAKKEERPQEKERPQKDESLSQFVQKTQKPKEGHEEEAKEEPAFGQEAPSEPKKPEQEKEPQEEIKQEAPPAQEAHAFAQEAPPEPEKPEETKEALPKEESSQGTGLEQEKEAAPEPESQKEKALSEPQEIKEQQQEAEREPVAESVEQSSQEVSQPESEPKEGFKDKIWTPSPEEISPEKPKPTQESQPEEEEKQIYDGMGAFFLKAAEWELSRSSMLGSLLSKQADIPNTEINIASEVLLYLQAFGLNRIEGLKQYDGKGLWKINGLEQAISSDKLEKLVNSFENIKNLPIAMTNEYSQVFSEICYIKIALADNTEICIDTEMRSLWNEDNVHSGFTSPLNKTLDILSENFVTNIHPAVICSVPGFKAFSKHFYDFVAAFEGIPERNITKIAIYDGNKEEIAKFTAIPNKKRGFIIGCWPWQEESKKFIEEDLRAIHKIYVENIKKEFYYSELKTNIEHSLIGQTTRVRVVLLRESAYSWPILMIMTNISESEMSIEDIILSYVYRWPNLKEGIDYFNSKTEKATYGSITITPAHDRVSMLKGEGYYNLLENESDFWTTIEFLLSGLNNYCQRHFFPSHYEEIDFSVIKDRFYGLSGYIQRKEGLLIIALVPPQGYAHAKDLEYAIHRLNETNIKDSTGARLFLKIEK